MNQANHKNKQIMVQTFNEKKEDNMGKNEITRRDFTKGLAAGALLGAGGLITANSIESQSQKSNRTPVGLQLYTVRDLTGKDFSGTLKKVAEIGYDSVEFAGFGNLTAKEIRTLLDDLGLSCAGSHEGFDRLNSSLSEVIDFNQAIGNSYIVCPSIPQEWRSKGVDGFKKFGEKLSAIGADLKKSGMQLCYHNHDFEFERAGRKYLIDYMFEFSDPKLVQAEVDVYWIKYANADPVRFINRYSGRCPLIHMKDMANDEKRSFAPVGAGIMDMKSIVEAARSAKAVNYIVEQDSTTGPVLEEIAISLKNMRELLK
jgi:sugar phosphate isomerase/epimerase